MDILDRKEAQLQVLWNFALRASSGGSRRAGLLERRLLSFNGDCQIGVHSIMKRLPFIPGGRWGVEQLGELICY